jgi:hypothetical protein
MGDKLFAIPWRLLRLDPDNKRFLCSIDKEKLKKAPGFDKNNWPTMGSREWGRQIHTYYGQTPYWEQLERTGGLGREAGEEPGTPRH